MPENLTKLENLLSEELEIFKEILRIEEAKREAIIKRDASGMENLSREQEKLLDKIVPLEKSRKRLTDKYQKKSSHKELTLKEITEIEDSGNSSLIKTGEELKKILNKTKSIQETNSILIKDNLELFSRMVDELKGFASADTGYGKKENRKDKTVNPMLLDKKI